jgi:hypothetical protein
MFWKIPSVRVELLTVWKGTSWYGVGKWLDWKGVRGMVWVGRHLICWKSCSNELRIGSRE